ncbi:GNAT family N-acetyltransferase [Gammaproteobacteria bacterium]|nr:GNAT family N-acetyltransferase [Gammaproteobacteria bacterium]
MVAFVGEKFAGYVTLKWQSDYKLFADDNIPEISNLNVLPSFRNKGTGSTLIKKCEECASKRSNVVGIGAGLYPDYGSAQRLYIKRDHLPDRYGATYNYEYVTPGKEHPLDDDLCYDLRRNQIENDMLKTLEIVKMHKTIYMLNVV